MPPRRLVGYRIVAMRCYGRGGGSSSVMDEVQVVRTSAASGAISGGFFLQLDLSALESADRGADAEVWPHCALEVDSVGALLVHRSAEDVTTDGVAARAPLLAHFAAVHADLAAVGEHL